MLISESFFQFSIRLFLFNKKVNTIFNSGETVTIASGTQSIYKCTQVHALLNFKYLNIFTLKNRYIHIIKECTAVYGSSFRLLFMKCSSVADLLVLDHWVNKLNIARVKWTITMSNGAHGSSEKLFQLHNPPSVCCGKWHFTNSQ